MRFLLWLIAIFALAAGVAMLAGRNDGYMLVVMPPWRVQISLNLVIVLLLLGFCGIYFLLRLIGNALDLPGRVGLYRARRQQEKAFNAFKEAVRALFEGRFSAAVQHAKQAYAGDAAPVTALMAARAFHGLHDEKRYKEWLGKAEKDSEGRVAALLTEAELALTARRFDDAAAALEGLRETGHRSNLATELMLKQAELHGHWNEVPELVKQLQDSKALQLDEALPIARRAHIEQLRLTEGDPQAQASYWHGLSKAQLSDTELLSAALPLLAKAGQAALARKAVENALANHWDSNLVAQYYQTVGEGTDAVASLAKAENWMGAHPRDGGLLYSLGRQCMAQQIWGKALHYLEEALESNTPGSLPKAVFSSHVHRALAQLYVKTNRLQEAAEHSRLADDCV